MRRVLLFLLMAAMAGGSENTLSRSDAGQGWLLLFDGASGIGWTEGKTQGWVISNGAFSFNGQQAALLGTTLPFGDFLLRFDFKAASAGRTPDLLVRYARTDSPEEAGYVIKLGANDTAWPQGSIVSVAKSEGIAAAPNQWHAVEVEAAGDQLRVSIDGRKVAEGKDSRGKAGYLGFVGKVGQTMQVRNLRLKPEGWQPLFNGSDLSNWQAVSVPPPKPPGGIKKILKLPSGKPKDEQWVVQSNAIHGQGGEGELQSLSLHSDFIVQLQTHVQDRGKKSQALLRLRADAKQWATGYGITLDPADPGAIVGFKEPRPLPAAVGAPDLETVAVAGRHFLIWVNGYPVTEFEDTRPEGQPIQKGAKSTAGAIAIATNTTVDVSLARAADLPPALGLQKATASPPLPVTTASAPPPAPPPAPAAPAPTVLAPTQTPEQIQDAKNKVEVKTLTTQVLQESDPHKQVDLYSQILQRDPDSSFAANGLRDAQAKLDKANEQQQRVDEEGAKKQEQAATNEAQGQAKLQEAEHAFTAGNLAAAAGALAVAERLLPGNPRVATLRRAIDAKNRFGQLIRYCASGAGLIALAGLVALAFRKRRPKVPVLIVVDGLDKGKKFLLKSEISHIGAVAQDGNARNEIVLKDVDRMISRFHCEIMNKKGQLYLMDCGSSNGTFVNGKRIPPKKAVRLSRGTRFSLGQVCAVEVGWERGS